MTGKRPTNDTERLRSQLRDAGLRCTAARVAVLQRLERATAPVTHAELAGELVPEGFDQATIFRNLVDLTEADLVTRTELGDHVWLFELRDPDHPGDGGHPHFVCVDCGGVTCLADVDFDTRTKKRAATIGQVTEVLLKGHCNACR